MAGVCRDGNPSRCACGQRQVPPRRVRGRQRAVWQTPKGFHQRLYSDFSKVAEHFVQPGRVRHLYDGVKAVDIRWTSAEIGQPIPDATFVLGPSVESGG